MECISGDMQTAYGTHQRCREKNSTSQKNFPKPWFSAELERTGEGGRGSRGGEGV